MGIMGPTKNLRANNTRMHNCPWVMFLGTCREQSGTGNTSPGNYSNPKFTPVWNLILDPHRIQFNHVLTPIEYWEWLANERAEPANHPTPPAI